MMDLANKPCADFTQALTVICSHFGANTMASDAVDVQQPIGDLVPGDDAIELEVSRELRGRLLALEAENSALALANENQREAYERCLDEVANHVVQALLNQKDLREECLKLKKKVLDLERQNRTLSDLFHQKLQLSSGAVPQVEVDVFTVPGTHSPVYEISSKLGSLFQFVVFDVSHSPKTSSFSLWNFTIMQLQVCQQSLVDDLQPGILEKHPTSPPMVPSPSQGNRDRPRGTSPASSSLDALSPFLKKKAQILEVLRKLEEADPLLTCPASYSPLVGNTDFSLQWKAERRWELSASSPGSNRMDGAAIAATQGPEPWASRLLVAQSGLEDLLRWKTGRGLAPESLQAESDTGILELENGGCGDQEPADDSSGPSSSSSSDDSGEQGELRVQEEEAPPLLLSTIVGQEKNFLQDADSYLSLMIENGIRGTVNGDRSVDIDGHRNSESWPAKEGLSITDSLSKVLEREVLRELSMAGKSQQGQELDCTLQSLPELSQGDVKLNSDVSAREEVEKVIEKSSIDCSSGLKPVDAVSETQSNGQNFISTYISSECPRPLKELDIPNSKNDLRISPELEDNKLSSVLEVSPHNREPRPLPLTSPSRIIKFLKMPSAAERTQNPIHLRLSPQLTRSSKIPCRNNYEVYHSPVPARRSFRGDESSTCAGRAQVAIDGDTAAVISDVSIAGDNVSSQCSPVFVRNSKTNPADLFLHQAQRTPNYENITGLDSSFVLQTCSSQLMQHLIRPVREAHLENITQPMSFSLPASPSTHPDKGLQRADNSLNCSGSIFHPIMTEQKPEIEPPHTASASLPSGPVRSKGSSPAQKPESGKKLIETPVGHLPFQVRLTALGKLKGVEGLQPAVFIQAEVKGEAGAERENQVLANNQRNRILLARPCDLGESPPDSVCEPRVYLRRGTGSKSLRQADLCVNGEPRVKCYHSNSVGSRADPDNCSPKSDHSSRHRPPPKSPQASRSSGRLQGAGNSSRGPQSPHGSPTKMPAKSPLRTSAPRGPLGEDGKPCILSSVPPLVQQLSIGRRSVTCAEYTPRTPPATRTSDKMPLSSTLHSAIEEKVMKGIQENMLRLQEQDRVPVVEVKQKNSSGIASWFGLKKSKLPALNRRPDAFKFKEEKRGVAASPPRRDGRVANKKVEVESLNISMLMEKAEDLRKALEAEKAYMRGRGHPGGIILEQTQSELKVIYSKEVTPDNFMRQLLNRVDGKDIVYENPLDLKAQLTDFSKLQRESKDPTASRSQRNGIVSHLQHSENASEPHTEDASIREEIPSDDSLTESVTSQHFTACGSLTRTLDSGIGTFPPPDYCSGTPNRSVPRQKTAVDAAPGLIVGGPPALPKVPRKARTLEREVPSMEEVLVPGQHHSVPAFHALLTTPEPTGGPRVRRTSKDSCVNPAQKTQQSKNWTFPNARVTGGSTDAFLSNSRELEVLEGSGRVPDDSRKGCDVPHRTLHAPLVFPGSIASRTPSASDVGEDVGTDMKSRGAGQAGLESSESLSDSLYDSLSSCGSQG